MIRYIGNSSASKKRKNSSRSSARNEPSTAVSRISIAAMNSRTFRSILQDARIARGIRKAVSSTRNRLMPSTPTS
jgi:hypothetical protein